MVIDMILDRRDWEKDGYTYYDPKDFYDAMLGYMDMGGEEISRAMDEGTEEDVKKALCNYIRDYGYNPNICDYINSVDWLELVDGKKPPFYDTTEFVNPPKIVKLSANDIPQALAARIDYAHKKESKMKKCSMLKKQESLHKTAESSRSDGAKFYDTFIKERATTLLGDYDVNQAQGGDAWYEIGNGVEDMERDHRDGFISYNDGGVEKTWSTTSWSIVGMGYQDARIEKDYDYLQEQCESDYKDYCESEGIECDLQSDEFYDYESEWWNESCDIYATAEVMLYSRKSYDGKYSLLGRISRNFDYTYGRQKYNEDDLEVRMDLTAEQLTQKNAEAFLAEFEKQLEIYSFRNGKQTIELDAK